jgi:3-phenylpropionate/trans-cinnamate dioxygenase ferredoxin subunit
MSKDPWIFVAEMKDLPQNIPRLIHPKGLGMIMLRRGEEVYALSNRCPHMGCALASGTLEGDVIRCPCHDWSFDVRTGELVMSREVKLRTFQTRTEDGKLFVRLED